MTATQSDLSRLSAVELRELVRTRKASPVEILDAHLAAIGRLNPKFNAIVTLVEDQARAAAKQAADSNGTGLPLHGLPVVIKDVTLTKGIRTTFGSPLYKDFVPYEDAAAVERLRKAGAIILGKTNTPEFATGANTVNELFGATRNPWNPALSPAGSSGGSAVAVAAGMVPLAQGTDFGCSIRIPAAFCGIVGVRTTGGLIPNRGMRLPWDGGQVHGPLARSAEDAALMLDGMVGLDPLWPISAAPPWRSALEIVQRMENAKGLRIAYVPDIAGFGVDREIEEISRRAVQRLEKDGAIVEVIDFSAADGFNAYKVLRGEWMVGQQLQRIEMLDKFGPNLAGNVRDGLKLTVRDTAAAENLRETVWKRFCDLFGRYDFLVTPAAPVPPYPIEKNYPDEVGGHKLDNYIDWIAPAFLVTLVGFPAGSVPAGLTAAKLPVGLQIVGPRFSEPQILGLSKLVQRNNPVGWPTYSS
jgi:amidase